MRTILHIVTKENDTLAQAVFAQQSASPENRVETVDLTAANPDYKALLGKIFEADSVQVW